jgi:hypothetical protein
MLKLRRNRFGEASPYIGDVALNLAIVQKRKLTLDFLRRLPA